MVPAVPPEEDDLRLDRIGPARTCKSSTWEATRSGSPGQSLGLKICFVHVVLNRSGPFFLGAGYARWSDAQKEPLPCNHLQQEDATYEPRECCQWDEAVAAPKIPSVLASISVPGWT